MRFLKGQRMQRQNLRRLVLRSALLAPLASLLVLVPNQLSAQATAARSRPAGVSGFFTYTRLAPDYGGSVNAFTLGGDYTKFYRLVSPAVEVRFKKSSLGTVSERTFGGGIRVEHAISYFHPYGDFLISSGTINFAGKNYIGANGTGSNGSVVYSYGGGVDYDFADQWSVRVDYQSEHWNLNETPAITLAPRALSFGVLYRFRFHRQFQ